MNEWLGNHRTAGRIILLILLITQVLTVYAIALSVWHLKDELAEAFMEVIKYIVTGKLPDDPE